MDETEEVDPNLKDRIYMSCNECGEVFDNIRSAYDHGLSEALDGNVVDWSILMEEEAF